MIELLAIQYTLCSEKKSFSISYAIKKDSSVLNTLQYITDSSQELLIIKYTLNQNQLKL